MVREMLDSSPGPGLKEGREKGQSWENRWEAEVSLVHGMGFWLKCLGILMPLPEAETSENISVHLGNSELGCCGDTSSTWGQVWAGVRDVDISGV